MLHIIPYLLLALPVLIVLIGALKLRAVIG